MVKYYPPQSLLPLLIWTIRVKLVLFFSCIVLPLKKKEENEPWTGYLLLLTKDEQLYTWILVLSCAEKKKRTDGFLSSVGLVPITKHQGPAAPEQDSCSSSFPNEWINDRGYLFHLSLEIVNPLHC